MTALTAVTIEQVRGVPVARVRGEVDASNSSAIEAELNAAVTNHSPGLVIDLTDAGYLDSAGIRLLFEIGERLTYRGQRLRVVAEPDSFISDVLETVRLTDRVAVDPTATTSVEALASSR
jgi:anti-anti-sigma factor